MDQELYQKYVEILKSELVPALGCTEPMAWRMQRHRRERSLDNFRKVEVLCSGNIIKNVKGVKVPNSGGMKGVEAAVVLGIVGGKAEQKWRYGVYFRGRPREDKAAFKRRILCV